MIFLKVLQPFDKKFMVILVHYLYIYVWNTRESRCVFVLCCHLKKLMTVISNNVQEITLLELTITLFVKCDAYESHHSISWWEIHFPTNGQVVGDNILKPISSFDLPYEKPL